MTKMTSIEGRYPSRNHLFLTHIFFASLIFIPLLNVCALEKGEKCTNPVGVEGTCIEIDECVPVINALQIRPISNETQEFVRRSLCGYNGDDHLLCCPSDDKELNITTLKPEVTEDVSRHPKIGLLRNDICGPEYVSQIVTGNEVYLKELPWMALLEFTIENGSPYRCGGSIINDRYVLTAAHCVTALPANTSIVAVRLGEHNLTSPIDCEADSPNGDMVCSPEPQDIPLEKIIVHPTYIGWPDVQYDIALIRLSRPVNFTDEAVRPICLPIGLAQQTKDLDGKTVDVAGWGSSWTNPAYPVPRKWTVPVISHSRCAEEFEDVVPISAVSQICTEDTKGNDACTVDSGGPLTHKENVQGRTRTILQGILSYGPRKCGSPLEPGVYTRVGHYMKWILDSIEP